MKHRAIISAAAIALLAAVCLPAINWADDGESRIEVKFLEEHGKQLKQQEKQLHAQADAMRSQAEAAKQQAHMATETAKIRVRSMFRGPGHPRFMTEIHEQAAKYRDADNEQDKSAAMKSLNEVVDKCFEDDMKVREQELAGIEERLNKLREQLERRRSKKQEIVDLQVKVAINEAEGLGFFSDAKGDVFKFRVPTPVGRPFDFNDTIFHAQPGTLKVANAWEAPANWNATAPTPSADAAPASVAAPAPPSPPGTLSIHGNARVVAPPVPTSAGELTVTNGVISVGQLSPENGAEKLALVFNRRPLKTGDEGDAVRLLQFQLNEYLEPSPGLAVDGDFGPETEMAIRTFQEQHELEATGVVDEATYKALDEAMKSSSPGK